MRLVFGGVLLACTIPALASVEPMDLKKLWMASNPAYGDNFYSVDENQVNVAISSYGYSNKQAVGWVAPQVWWIQPSSLYFRRMYKGSPAVDHFYTTRIDDYTRATSSYGYSDEGAEGALRQGGYVATGMAALFRLSRNSPNGDVEHWYGIDTATRSSKLQAGWFDEGVEGYIWPLPPSNVNLQGGGTNVSIYKFPGTPIYVRGSGVNEPGGSSFFGTCGGSADVYINGAFVKHISSTTWTYGLLPGTQNIYGCYDGPYYQGGNYHIEFTGFAAHVSGSNIGGAYDYVTEYTPYVFDGFLSYP